MPTGWHGSNRRKRLPSGWDRIRHIVLERDRYRCQWVREDTCHKCGLPANQVDHRINNASGGSDRYSNLQSLCPYHHQVKSSMEGAAASARKRRKKPEWHPGVI
jgi:5-methylcytosine-specific restriction endonuclease McrA